MYKFKKLGLISPGKQKCVWGFATSPPDSSVTRADSPPRLVCSHFTERGDEAPQLPPLVPSLNAALIRLLCFSLDSGISGEDQAPSEPLRRLSERAEGPRRLKEPARIDVGGGRQGKREGML